MQQSYRRLSEKGIGNLIREAAVDCWEDYFGNSLVCSQEEIIKPYSDRRTTADTTENTGPPPPGKKARWCTNYWNPNGDGMG